jgi:hypothetical protein
MEVYNDSNEVITDKEYVLHKWKEDFQGLYSGNSSVRDTDFENFIQFRKDTIESNMRDPLWEENPHLNRNFTMEEVTEAVLKCKNGKATGVDKIPNEVLKNDDVIKALVHLFQLCLDSGKVPSLWLKSIISPIEKNRENDPRIPLNYRGISLICCTAKIYSGLLNKRVVDYLDDKQIISDEQNGFRKDRSCRDHIFSLDAVVRSQVSANSSVFAAFIDFQKAFDCIDRDFLLYKILDNGINGKMYWAIKSLYNGNQACIKINNYLTDWFDCTFGVRQGDTLSPTLFSLYINDLVNEINSLNKGIIINDLQVSVLLYADDVVIVAENEDNLQTMLNTLSEWSRKWKIYVNQSKSKVVQFRKANCEQSKHVFRVGSLELDYAQKYKYLGVFFNEHLDYDENANTLSESAGRALGAIVSKLKRNNFMAYSTYTKLYESCVVPVADYASEIWGFKNFNKANIIQNRAMRIFLGVHRFAPVAGLEGDMAWLSPQYRRWLNMLRYWNRLVCMDTDRLTRKIFDYAHTAFSNGCTNWCSDIFNILADLGLQTVFDRKCPVNINNCKLIMIDKQKSRWLNVVQNKPKLRFYALFKDCLDVEKYVTTNLASSERSVLAQIRYGILPLHVETGRFNNTKLEDRKCYVCNLDSIEDECHFLFECEAYHLPRDIWSNSIIEKCPDFHYLQLNDQLKCLFTVCPRATAKFIKACLTIRKNVLYS